MDLRVIIDNLGFMLAGLDMTFKLAFIAIGGSLPLGIILALCRLSSRPWLYYPATVYVHFFRGLPLILVIFWLYFLLPLFTGDSLERFTAAAVSFVVYEASYFSEIVRSGIQSVGKGQVQAAQSTGLGHHQIMVHVVLPQAMGNMLPSLVTHCVIIFQDTSLAYVIGLREFLRRVNLVDAREARSVELYLFAGAVYLVICSLGALLCKRLEKKRCRQGVQ